jgi:hypothetical protein
MLQFRRHVYLCIIFREVVVWKNHSNALLNFENIIYCNVSTSLVEISDVYVSCQTWVNVTWKWTLFQYNNCFLFYFVYLRTAWNCNFNLKFHKFPCVHKNVCSLHDFLRTVCFRITVLSSGPLLLCFMMCVFTVSFFHSFFPIPCSFLYYICNVTCHYWYMCATYL